MSYEIVERRESEDIAPGSRSSRPSTPYAPNSHEDTQQHRWDSLSTELTGAMTAVLTRFAPAFMSRSTPAKPPTPKQIEQTVHVEPDADGHTDDELEGLDQPNHQEPRAGAVDDYVDSDDGEEADDGTQDSGSDDDDDEDIIPARRRLQQKRSSAYRARPKPVVEEESEEASSDGDEVVSEPTSEVEVPWEAEADAEVELEDGSPDPNRCIFCQETEENDPSEDFEEMLNCAACGDNAHRQCARDAESLPLDEDAPSWRCPECVDKDITPDERGGQSRSRQQSSAPRMARDLLPPLRAMKAGSHSIYTELILNDDPMDGSRSLRKRKSSGEEERPRTESRKRRRGSSEVIVLANRNNLRGVSGPLGSSNERRTTPQRGTPGTDGTPKSTRLRYSRPDRPLLTTLARTDEQFIVSFNFGSTTLKQVREETRKRKRRDRDRARRTRKADQQPAPPARVQEVSHYPALQSSSFLTAFFDLHERDGDAPKIEPYGGILTDAEADTSRTFPQISDRKKFEGARLKAEEEWRKKLEAAAAEQARTSQKVSSQPSRIKCIHFGGYEIDTFHASPYPEEYSRNRVLHVCEFCLKYMNSDFVAWRHKLKCPARHPPGDEIYHDRTFSFFEVDGRKNPVYCQNLCLLAKLFLGSKTLYYDVEPFLFYVMTENNNEGCHFVGYFSKEKRSSSQNNVSCILVLPIHQRRGFGHMLIEFSYLLTKVEEKTGSPEKPLSDMGLVSYRNYWRRVMCLELSYQNGPLSITEISERTGMTADDIVCALEGLRALVRDPVTRTYALRLDQAYFKQYLEAYEKKGYHKIDPKALMWVPYQMGRTNSHYENAPIQTVAQREEEPATAPEEGVQLAEQDVSVQDFGKSATDEVGTELEEKSDSGAKLSQGLPKTLFPNFSPDKQIPGRRKARPVTPSTPVTDAVVSDAPIPVTRFEVYPPLPGSQRRRPGRPFGSRSSGRRLRFGPSLGSTPSSQLKNVRTTRSARADLANGYSEGDADGEVGDPRAAASAEVQEKPGSADGDLVTNGGSSE